MSSEAFNVIATILRKPYLFEVGYSLGINKLEVELGRT